MWHWNRARNGIGWIFSKKTASRLSVKLRFLWTPSFLWLGLRVWQSGQRPIRRHLIYEKCLSVAAVTPYRFAAPATFWQYWKKKPVQSNTDNIFRFVRKHLPSAAKSPKLATLPLRDRDKVLDCINSPFAPRKRNKSGEVKPRPRYRGAD